jgi:hypothetical protein
MTRVHKINPEATMRLGIASTIIAGLFLMLPSVSAHARVTGVTFEPKSPIVGHSVTAIATDDQKHKVDKWIWYCTLTDAGTHDPITMEPTVPGRARLKLLCGGTYKVFLRVIYGGPMPPSPETVSASITVARPDALKIIKGLESANHYDEMGNAIEIQSQVMCRNADAGEHLLGMAQRRIRNRTWWNGKVDADQPWEPKPGGFWVFQRSGAIGSTVVLKIDSEDWAKIPPGKPVVTWDEEIRLVYGVGSARREGEWTHHGGGKLVEIECPLGTEHLSIIKVDASHWAIRERARPSQTSPPRSRSSIRKAD